MVSATHFDDLLAEIRGEYLDARRQASLSGQISQLEPAEAAGRLVREHRKKQGQSLQDLCDLSGVAYSTLSKIEHGHRSVRLGKLQKVLNALGLKLWIG
ncbi:MAG: helix-turn-helix transcriptional regulator [Proteobacteria bacterium]|nr:helix-turn-helix transcriptional regulator [Pseudomonadota bacterium]